MGLVGPSLRDTGRVLTDRRIVGHVTLIAVLLWVISMGASWIPFAGLLGFVIFAFLIGGMYAVANAGMAGEEVSIDVAIELVRTRWLSLLGGYAFILVSGFILGLLVGLPTVLLVFLLIASPGEGLLGLGAVLLVLYAVVLVFFYALFMQLIFPLLVIEEMGAVDVIPEAVRQIRSAPGAVFGFTVTRLLVEYVPMVLGLLISLGWAWDTVLEVVAETQDRFDALMEDPSTPFDPLEIVLQTADAATIIGVLVILLVFTLLGEVLRILYTTAFVRRLTGHEAPFGGHQT